jgi:hypothetical protein
MGVIPSVIASVVSGVKFGNSGTRPAVAPACARAARDGHQNRQPSGHDADHLERLYVGHRRRRARGRRDRELERTPHAHPQRESAVREQGWHRHDHPAHVERDADGLGRAAARRQLFLTAANLQLASGTLSSHVPGNAAPPSPSTTPAWRCRSRPSTRIACR